MTGYRSIDTSMDPKAKHLQGQESQDIRSR